MLRTSRLLSRTVLSALSILIYFMAPLWVFAAGITTPIVPQETCPLGYGAFFTVIQNLVNDSTIFASIVVVLLIAYAGFLFVTNPASPDNVSKGRAVLVSAVIGFVIVISAWLVVNEFISVFTTGNLSSITALLQPSSNSGNCLPTAAKNPTSNVTKNTTLSTTKNTTPKIVKNTASATVVKNPTSSTAKNTTQTGVTTPLNTALQKKSDDLVKEIVLMISKQAVLDYTSYSNSYGTGSGTTPPVPQKSPIGDINVPIFPISSTATNADPLVGNELDQLYTNTAGHMSYASDNKAYAVAGKLSIKTSGGLTQYWCADSSGYIGSITSTKFAAISTSFKCQ